MTTGSTHTGTAATGSAYHAAKAWLGDDGQYDPVTGEEIPHFWRMASQWLRSSNPNKIGTVNHLGVYSQRTNHSWNKTQGPPESIGYSALGDQSIANTFPQSQFDLIWTANEELELLAKLIAEVNSHSFNMGVSLAEVDKLAETVTSTVRNLVGGIGDLASMRLVNFVRRFGAEPPSRKKRKRLTTQDVSGRFLEMRYAWAPTIADVYEAAKAFEAISNGPRKVKFKASRRIRRQTWYGTNYCRVPQTIEVRRAYRVLMREEVGFQAQLGLSHPGSILWERLPWSFVIDWFLPIGTYLSVLGVLPLMKARWVCTSSIRWNSYGSQKCDPVISGGFDWAPPLPQVNWEKFNVQRTVSFVPPHIPTPKLQVAGAIQGRRIFNALALAHQVLSKYV